MFFCTHSEISFFISRKNIEKPKKNLKNIEKKTKKLKKLKKTKKKQKNIKKQKNTHLLRKLNYRHQLLTL